MLLQPTLTISKKRALPPTKKAKPATPTRAEKAPAAKKVKAATKRDRPTPKKPEVGRAIVELHDKSELSKPLSKAKIKRLQSRFGNRSEEIIELLETNEYDSAFTMMYRALLQTLVDVVPVLELNVRRSKGKQGAYQLNMTLGQMRETIAAVQSNMDRSLMGERIVQKHVQPALMNIASQIQLMLITIENSVRSELGQESSDRFVKKTLEPLKIGIAQHFSQQLTTVTQDVSRALS